MLISARDVVETLLLPPLAVCALVLPQRTWIIPSRWLGFILTRMQKPDRDGRIGSALGSRLDRQAIARVEERLMSERVLDRIHLLRAAVTRTALPPAVLRGREYLDEALDRGNGAVLWVGAFAHASTVAKRAMHEAGYHVTHLSRPSHTSPSRYGIGFLNRWRMRIEDRFLEERVMLHGDDTLGAVRKLARRLRNNGVISITVGDEARQKISVPFLDASMLIAPGAVRLAQNSRAALIPVVVQRTAADEFEVILRPPLSMEKDSVLQSGSSAFREYAVDLESWVVACPEQWHAWRTVRPRAVDESQAE